MAEQNNMGRIFRAARERAGLTIDEAGDRLADAEADFAHIPAHRARARRLIGEIEGDRNLLLASHITELLAGVYGLGRTATDALHAAGGTTPPDVTTIAADPERWDAVRSLDALRAEGDALRARLRAVAEARDLYEQAHRQTDVAMEAHATAPAEERERVAGEWMTANTAEAHVLEIFLATVRDCCSAERDLDTEPDIEREYERAQAR